MRTIINNLPWAAGLFEGEGTISLVRNKRYKGLRPRLELQMTDFDVVRQFKRTIQVGHLFERRKRSKSQRKRVLIWATACKADIKAVLIKKDKS